MASHLRYTIPSGCSNNQRTWFPNNQWIGHILTKILVNLTNLGVRLVVSSTNLYLGCTLQQTSTLLFVRNPVAVFGRSISSSTAEWEASTPPP